ncbi:MAG: PD-(D/E)XK nuclease family protein, partial [Proteobacteria bacterium]|nr:PD-(D/E)XK nuclease family protein [Pseudomonadota bacterium]
PVALAWNRGQPLPGGTRTLELQSLCPFRAAAELRLGAVPVIEPVPGLDRRERGQILHRALQGLWEALRDSRTLQERAANVPALAQLVRAVAGRAIDERLAQRMQPLPPPLVHNELQRLTGLIEAMLRQELQRSGAAEFSVRQLEQRGQGTLAGVPVRVRMDRLDQLEDGRLVVIDYKSGADEAFQPMAERPRQPQLLAYALLAAATVANGGGAAGAAGVVGVVGVAGVAAVYLRADGVRWRGAVADPKLLPPLKPQRKSARAPLPPWDVLQAHWRTVIERLVQQFASGDATVDPRRDACRRCHLSALCRIDAAVQVVNEAESDDESETVDAS